VREYYSAKRLLTALEGYLRDHGGSEFAKSRAAEHGRVRAEAEKAVAESPQGIAEMVEGFFKGRVTSFNPGTLEIEVAYSFEEAGELEDWRAEVGTWEIQKGWLRCQAAGHGRVWWKAEVQPKGASVSCLARGKARDHFALMLNGTGAAKWSPLMGLAGWQSNAIGCIHLNGAAVRHKTFRVFGGPHRLNFLRSGDRADFYIDGRRRFSYSQVPDLTGKQVGLGTAAGEVFYDQVVIKTALDRAWVDSLPAK